MLLRGNLSLPEDGVPVRVKCAQRYYCLQSHDWSEADMRKKTGNPYRESLQTFDAPSVRTVPLGSRYTG